MSGDREACLQAGMDDCVSKPLAVDELERLLSQWSGRSEQPGGAHHSGIEYTCRRFT